MGHPAGAARVAWSAYCERRAVDAHRCCVCARSHQVAPDQPVRRLRRGPGGVGCRHHVMGGGQTASSACRASAWRRSRICSSPWGSAPARTRSTPASRHAPSLGVTHARVGRRSSTWRATPASAAVFAYPLSTNGAKIGVLTLYQDLEGELSVGQHDDSIAMAEVLTETVLSLQDAAPEGDARRRPRGGRCLSCRGPSGVGNGFDPVEDSGRRGAGTNTCATRSPTINPSVRWQRILSPADCGSADDSQQSGEGV